MTIMQMDIFKISRIVTGHLYKYQSLDFQALHLVYGKKYDNSS